MSKTREFQLRPQAELEELMRLIQSMPWDVDRLVEFLSDENILIREAAATRLGQMEDLDISVFMDMLGNDALKVRCTGALALGRRKVRSAVPVLRHLLTSDPSDQVRVLSAMALSDIGGSAALDRLLDALGDRSPNVRHAACSAFRRRKSQRAIPKMLSMLSDPYFYVRLCVVETLVSLNVADARLVGTAEGLLTDPVFLNTESNRRGSVEEMQAILNDREELRKYAEETGQTTKEARKHMKSALQILRKDDFMSRSALEQLVERARKLVAESPLTPTT